PPATAAVIRRRRRSPAERAGSLTLQPWDFAMSAATPDPERTSPEPDDPTVDQPTAGAKPVSSALGQTYDYNTGTFDTIQAARLGRNLETVKVPGYEILAELGHGGMGVVYKARDTRLDRVVALKMILAGIHATASQLARFVREAKAVAQFQHPNIVQIYEIN